MEDKIMAKEVLSMVIKQSDRLRLTVKMRIGVYWSSV